MRRRARSAAPRCLSAVAMAGVMLVSAASFAAQPGVPALTLQTGADGAQTYSISIQVLLLMTALTLMPAALTIMTSFARIIIVLAILRQALGLNQTPSNQILIGLALFLTLFIMTPVFQRLHDEALVPYLEDKVTQQQAFTKAMAPVKSFMLDQTRETDLHLFADIKGETIPSAGPESASLAVLVPAFITSELKTAFQIGFLLFIPFLIIDLVVASVLMAMGMMMLSPMMISLPFKIMLFVLIDGWSLTIGTLASSFAV